MSVAAILPSLTGRLVATTSISAITTNIAEGWANRAEIFRLLLLAALPAAEEGAGTLVAPFHGELDLGLPELNAEELGSEPEEKDAASEAKDASQMAGPVEAIRAELCPPLPVPGSLETHSEIPDTEGIATDVGPPDRPAVESKTEQPDTRNSPAGSNRRVGESDTVRQRCSWPQVIAWDRQCFNQSGPKSETVPDDGLIERPAKPVDLMAPVPPALSDLPVSEQPEVASASEFVLPEFAGFQAIPVKSFIERPFGNDSEASPKVRPGASPSLAQWTAISNLSMRVIGSGVRPANGGELAFAARIVEGQHSRPPLAVKQALPVPACISIPTGKDGLPAQQVRPREIADFIASRRLYENVSVQAARTPSPTDFSEMTAESVRQASGVHVEEHRESLRTDGNQKPKGEPDSTPGIERIADGGGKASQHDTLPSQNPGFKLSLPGGLYSSRQVEVIIPGSSAAPAGTVNERTVEPEVKSFSGKNTTAANEVSVRVSEVGEETVDVRFKDRAGELHVTVHSRDAGLTRSLREALPELVTRLEQRGFEAQTWRPAVPGHLSQPEPNEARAADFDPSGSSADEGSARWARQGGGQQGRQGQAHRQWMEDSEAIFGRHIF